MTSNKQEDKKPLNIVLKTGEVVHPTTSPETVNGLELDNNESESNLTKLARIAAENTPFIISKKEYDKYAKYNVYPDAATSEEDLNRQRAENQGFFEQFGRSAGQMIWNEMVLGILKAPGQLYDAIVTDNWRRPAYEQLDFSNPYTQFFEDAQDRAKERLEIYRKDPNKSFDFTDSAWWADNLVSVASTVSLMVPGYGISKGLSGLSKAINTATKLNTIGKDVNSVSKFLKAAAGSEKLSARGAAAIYEKVAKGESKFAKGVAALTNPQTYEKISRGMDIANMALISRIGENYMEARETYKAVYDDVINQLNSFDDNARERFLQHNPEFVNKSNEDIAKYIAGESANKTYKEDFAMLLMDIAQFKGVSSFLKAGANKASTISLRAANKNAIIGVDKAAEKSGIAKWFSPARRSAFVESFAPKNILKTVETLELSEGVEEGYQGIVQASSEDVAKRYFDPNYTDKTVESYLHDPHIWEQAFWGVLGGIAFQAGGKGLNKLSNKLYTKLNKDLSEKDIKTLLTDEGKLRAAEITGRKDLVDKFINNSKDIEEKGINPFAKTKDGEDIPIKDASEKAILIEKNVNDFIENLTMNAINRGNYNLLEEWVQNSDVDKAINEAGGHIDQSINTRLVQQMKDIKDEYETTYSDIIRNTVATNPFVIDLAARHIIRSRRALNDMENAIATQKDALAYQSDYNKFSEHIDADIAAQALSYALGYLDKYDFGVRHAALKERTAKTDNTMLSSYGYEQEVKELNKEKESFVDFIMDYGFHLNAEAQGLYETAKIQSGDEKQATLDKIINLFKKTSNKFSYDVAIEDGKTKKVKPIQEYNKRKYNEGTRDLIKSIASIEFQKGLNARNTYETKQDFVDLYDNFEATIMFDAKNKFNEAYNRVLNHIKGSKDYDAALSDLLNNRVKDKALQRALDILKIGYYNRQLLNEALTHDIDLLKNKDKKVAEEKKTIIEDGVRVPVNDDTTPPAEEKKTTTITPTDAELNAGLEQETEEVGDEASREGGLDKEKEEVLDSAIKDILDRSESSDIKRFYDSKEAFEDSLIAQANNAAKIVIQALNRTATDEFVKKIDNEEKRKKQLDKLTESVIGLLRNNYTFGKDEAEHYAPIGIKNALSNVSYLGISKDSNIFKIVSAYDELKSAITYAENNQEILDKFREFFMTLPRSCYDDVNGKLHLNLNQIAKTIIIIAKDESKGTASERYYWALDAISTVKQFINSEFAVGYGINEEQKRDFNNYTAHDIIQKVYELLTSEERIANHMHFDAPSDRDIAKENFTIFGQNPDAKLKVRKDPDKASISLYFTDKYGIDRELGYIGVVSSNDTQTAYYRNYGEGLRYRVDKWPDDHISINAELQNLVNAISDGANPENKNNWLYLLFLANHNKQVKTHLGNKYNTYFDKFKDSDLWKSIINSEAYYRLVRDENGKPVLDEQGRTQQDFNSFLAEFAEVIFYELNSGNSIGNGIKDLSSDTIKQSFQEFVNKIYKNYEDTFKIQTSSESYEVRYNSDDLAGAHTNVGTEQDIANSLDTGFATKDECENHPYVYSDGVNMYSENGKQIPFPVWMGKGMSGIYLYTSGETPIIANVTNTKLLHDYNQGQQSETYNAVREHIRNLMFEYLNTENTKDVEAAYNKLYEQLSSLMGSGKLFKGFIISELPSKDAFAIKVNDKNSPMHNKPILTIFKYNNRVKYDRENNRYIFEDKDKDITHYYKARFRTSLGYIIDTNKELKDKPNLDFDNESEVNKAIREIYIKHITNAILNGVMYKENNEEGTRTKIAILGIGLRYYDYQGLKFNSDATIAKDAFDHQNTASRDITPYITREQNGDLTFTFGSKKFTYHSYSQFLVKNNAVTTTFDGRVNPTDNIGDTPKSVYVDISVLRSPVEETVHETTFSDFDEYLKEYDGKTVFTKSILEAMGFTKEQIETYTTAKKGLEIVSGRVKINLQNTKDNASYHPSDTVKTHIHAKMITEVANNKSNGLRILIHEKVHEHFDEQLFKKTDAVTRVKAIDECYTQFMDSLNDNTPNSIREFAERFSNEYSTSDAILRAKEFVAEVYTRKDLAEYLNGVDYKPKYKVENEQKKSLLQYLFEILMKLFGFNFESLNKNSILSNIYDIAGNNTIDKATENTEDGSVGFTTSEVGSKPVEEQPKKRKINRDSFMVSTIPYGDRSTSKEDAITKDYRVNPDGVIVVSSINDFVSRFPIDKQAQIEAEVAQNRLEYVCQI